MTTTSRLRTVSVMVVGAGLVAGLPACGLITGGSDTPFCELLSETAPAFRAEPLAALGADAVASDWRAHFTLSHQRYQRLISSAPPELTPPLNDLLLANDRLAVFYAEAEYDPRKVDSGALRQLLADSRYPEAVASVRAYAQDTCDLGEG